MEVVHFSRSFRPLPSLYERRANFLSPLHSFYTLLPPTAANANERTFCLLPHTPPIRACFTPNTNSHASDEITAHIEMFTEKSDGMYELGSRTCSLLGEWLNAAREGRMGQAKAAQLGKEKEKEKVERWV